MTKEQIAGILEQIATLLELKDQNSFDPADLVSTYRRGAAIDRVAGEDRSWTRFCFNSGEQEAKGQDERVTSLRSL
jgi:hypothetical protein